MLKGRKTVGKGDDVSRRPGRPEAPEDVFEELRTLYAQYGAGEVPQHIIELAKRLEAELEHAPASGGRSAGKPVRVGSSRRNGKK